ncbi:hypothetical protein D9756_008981 [Leucocoprinus leucothites]|uniref:NACHT domain-containing protein n=1 Tax=Leucocoprinus leucothites TaxID=201217 RepID=A0A8H5CX51_9AGAR|nr:hypothetical protein D9756_008981 [Leucoagaricus leucothites]
MHVSTEISTAPCKLSQTVMFFHLTNVRRYFRRRPGSDIVTSAGGSVESSQLERHSQSTSELLNNAHNFSISHSSMHDFSNTQIQQLVLQTIMNGDANATVNSSARYPPPRCHEGTREKVVEKLKTWFHDPVRQSKAIWLYGPAGTGKSAVAQTFAEYCEAENCLGATFFFSRPNHRDRYETIIPTIAYQLAITFPSYQTMLSNVIAADTTVLDKAPRVQLKKLIVEPFSDLYVQNNLVARRPLLVVLDGLDECYGLKGQLELVEMIEEVNKLPLPFLWLVCSRPEPHLVYIFSRAIECDRHQLLIDADTRQDVEKYLRDGFKTMQIELLGMDDDSWPPPELFSKVVDITDGLFILGTTIIGYIGNSAYANPKQRLTDFLAFMEHANRIATDNPLIQLSTSYTPGFSWMYPSLRCL